MSNQYSICSSNLQPLHESELGARLAASHLIDRHIGEHGAVNPGWPPDEFDDVHAAVVHGAMLILVAAFIDSRRFGRPAVVHRCSALPLITMCYSCTEHEGRELALDCLVRAKSEAARLLDLYQNRIDARASEMIRGVVCGREVIPNWYRRVTALADANIPGYETDAWIVERARDHVWDLLTHNVLETSGYGEYSGVLTL